MPPKENGSWKNAVITAVVTVAVGAIASLVLGFPLLKLQIERMEEGHREILERIKALEKINTDRR